MLYRNCREEDGNYALRVPLVGGRCRRQCFSKFFSSVQGESIQFALAPCDTPMSVKTLRNLSASTSYSYIA